MDPFDALIQNRAAAASGWAARTFATGSTFRIFQKKTSKKARKMLVQRIGDGERLVRGKHRDFYTLSLVAQIEWFRNHVRTNRRMKNKRPNFGQAAKLTNLYVKALLGLPSELLHHKRKLEKSAHVILDNVVLKRMWGSRRIGIGPFKNEMEKAGFNKLPTLRELGKKDYLTLQGILATAARKRGVAPILYDYVWAERDL
ncbi:MAG TPA: hypothetical protein VGZ48_04450 [Candidatus Acidoferrales bacterium]|jgi:hypothetical protein|nr:hypothetical protein [Candidatus Acidoferrales bacterium]